jgi:catechol 2,3-dioxygenase-like lactoylglutathione lyase family enzyme
LHYGRRGRIVALATARMIDHIDHIVLTTRDKPACIRFYTEVLGMKLVTFKTPSEERLAFTFGAQKINLHEWGREFSPRAHVAVPGSLDLCFIAAVSLDEVMARLRAARIPIVEGPVKKTGATGPIRSVYVRDPDLNLVEISVYES